MSAADPAAPRERAGFDGIALAIIAAGAVLRFTRLGQQSFWYDEVHSVLSAGGSEAPTFLDTALSSHGALHLVLLRLWIPLVGHSEAAARSLSAVFGVLGLVIFHRVLRRWAGRGATRMGLALLAFSPYHLAYSQEARNYALLFAAGMLAMLAALAEIERPSARTFVLAVLGFVLAGLSNLAGLFLIGVVGVIAWAVGRPRGYRIWRFVLLAGVVVLVLQPWIRSGAQATGRFRVGADPVVLVKGEAPRGLLSIPYSLYEFALGRSLGPGVDELKRGRLPALVSHLTYLLPIMGAVLLVAGLGLVSTRGRTRIVLLTWFALPLGLMAALSAVNLKAANSRYALPALAPFFVYLALGLEALRPRALRLSAFVVLLAIMSWSDVRYFTVPSTWKYDARSAGRLLASEARRSDAVVVYALDYPVLYYAPDSLHFLRPAPRDFRSDSAVAAWLAAHAGSRRLWLVECQGWWVDPKDRMRRVCDSTRVREGAWRFEKLPVYRYAAGVPR